MKKFINILLVITAIAALAVTAVEMKPLLASAKKNTYMLAVVLKRNAAMRAQIDTLKPADAPATLAPKEQPSQPNRKLYPYEEEAKAKAELIAKDPEYARKYYANLRSGADKFYSFFSRVYGLTKEQREALTDAFFQRLLRIKQIDAEWRAAKENENSDLNLVATNLDAKRRESIDELEAAEKKALGDDLYQQLKLYDTQRPAWTYVDVLGGQMSIVDIPLSAEQASQLASVIMDAASTPWLNDVDWDAVDAAAAKFLTPEQLDFFKNVELSMPLGVMFPRHAQELDNAMKKLAQKPAK